MTNILSGQVIINNQDLWNDFHAFLREEKKGGRENLNALLAPAKTKEHVAVNLREQNGESYSSVLNQKSEGRDVTLHIAIHATSIAQFVSRYSALISFLKTGNNGWLNFSFPTLGLTMRMFCKEFPGGFTSLSNLWVASEQCGAFKVTFREPVSSF